MAYPMSGWEMDRKNLTITHKEINWKLQSVFPADFLNSHYWPFSHYILNEDSISESKKVLVKRDWKLKPKQRLMEDKEKHVENILFTTGIVSPYVGPLGNTSINVILEDTELKELLLSGIFALSYGLMSGNELIGDAVTHVTKDMILMLYYRSKHYGVEPYTLLGTPTELSVPELYNPRRYDFNLLVLNTGITEENKNTQEAINRVQRGK